MKTDKTICLEFLARHKENPARFRAKGYSTVEDTETKQVYDFSLLGYCLKVIPPGKVTGIQIGQDALFWPLWYLFNPWYVRKTYKVLRQIWCTHEKQQKNDRRNQIV